MKQSLLAALAGFAVSLPLIVFCIWATGGGHGNYVPAIVVFPYSMLVSFTLYDRISGLAVALIFFQFPIYGVIVSRAPRGLTWIALLIAHTAVAVAAALLNKGSFSNP